VLCCVKRCRLEAGNRPRNEVVRLTKPVSVKPKSIHESEVRNCLSLSVSLSVSLFVYAYICLHCYFFANPRSASTFGTFKSRLKAKLSTCLPHLGQFCTNTALLICNCYVTMAGAMSNCF